MSTSFGAAGAGGPQQLTRRQAVRLGLGAAVGTLNVRPRWPWQAPDPQGSWLVFVSEHRANLGFVVRDDSQAGFASAYRALGGGAVVGLAISSRFREEPDAPIQQVFTRLVLQASPGSRSVRPAPLLGMASERGFDELLKRHYGIRRALTGREAARLRVGDDFKAPYELLGGQPVLGAPATHPTRWKASAYQRFDNAVIALHRPRSDRQIAELAPVATYLRAAGYFPEAPFAPRVLPVHPMVPPPIVRHGDTAQPYVFITIDDCWDAELTSRCLDIARDERVKITFFPVGAVIHENPPLWRRAVVDGHSVENHTQLHLPFTELSDSRIRWEIEEASRQLNHVLGYQYLQRFMRPPQGAGVLDYQDRVLRISQAMGYHIAMWTVDSKGWLYPYDDGDRAQDFVLGNLAGKLAPGAILLLHALASDVAALPRLAREIHGAGLQSVNLRDQLRQPGARDQRRLTCPAFLYESLC